MAKLKAPLMSLGASGAIGKSLVFFPWKGIDAVREYVVPSNPQTQPQNDQREHLRAAVTLIHTAQSAAAPLWNANDPVAYAELARLYKAAQTWFNEAVRQFVNQRVATLRGCIYRATTTTPGVDQLFMSVQATRDPLASGPVTAGTFFYGTSPSALTSSQAATVVAELCSTTVLLLTTGIKYYWQFRSTLPNDLDGTRSGIHHGTPT